MMDDIEIAEYIYDVMRSEASSGQQMAQVIDDMLSHKTDNRLYQNVVIIMAMIHANVEGH
jgi:hypothetical protein